MVLSFHAQEPSVFVEDGGFGGTVGATYGFVNLGVKDLDKSQRIWARNQSGFNAGVFYNIELDRRIRIRPGINLVILENQLVYEDESGLVIEKNIFPSYVEIPIQFVFANKDFGKNISAVFGVKLNKSLRTGRDEELIVRDSFSSAEFGIGKEFSLKHFRISPELTYSFGLENLYRYSTIPEFSDHLDYIKINQLSLRFHFY
jgi:hypothetical protein